MDNILVPFNRIKTAGSGEEVSEDQGNHCGVKAAIAIMLYTWNKAFLSPNYSKNTFIVNEATSGDAVGHCHFDGDGVPAQ